MPHPICATNGAIPFQYLNFLGFRDGKARSCEGPSMVDFLLLLVHGCDCPLVLLCQSDHCPLTTTVALTPAADPCNRVWQRLLLESLADAAICQLYHCAMSEAAAAFHAVADSATAKQTSPT
jgi:hypothetical protein